VGSSSGTLALLAAGELGKVTVVVTLPITISDMFLRCSFRSCDIHLVVEDLGLARLRLWNEGLVKDVKDILADLLKLELDLLTVLADDANVLVGSLLLLLLLDGGDDAPGGTAGSDNVLVCDREEVALIDGELTSELGMVLDLRVAISSWWGLVQAVKSSRLDI